jgi:hemophore-related protein
MDSAINTTCSYPQVVAALNAQSPAAAAKFNNSAMAQGWLRSFLASPPPQRAQMAQQAEGMPGAAQYIGLIGQITTTCNNF